MNSSPDVLPQTIGTLSPTAETPRSRGAIGWHAIGLLAGLAIFGIAAVVLFHILSEISWASLQRSIGLVPLADIAVAAGFTMISYAALCGYDLLALRHLRVEGIGVQRTAFTAFIAHAFSFMLGFGVLSGGAVRLRLYGDAGASPGKVAQIGITSAFIFWTGLAAVGAGALTLAPTIAGSIDGLPVWMNTATGFAMLVVLLGSALWLSVRPRQVALGGFTLPLPGWRTLAAAVAIGAIDTLAAAAALYALIPDALPGGFAEFIAIFVIATAAGVVSHVPGGLGVFEAVVLLALPTEPTPDIVGALLLFRALYYVLPFVIALSLLGLSQIGAYRREIDRGGSFVLRALRPLAPRILALTVFVGGIMLLLSGALPAESDRLHELRHFIPLPFVETSHLLASVVGFVLLVVARGLLARLASAWWLAVGLLVAAAIFSLTKGFDYEEAIVCLGAVGLLVLTRREFYRLAAFPDAVPPVDWIVSALIAVGASVWLGLFAYRHIDYSADLWWSFAYHGDAPRFLRATLAVAVVAIGLSVYRLVYRKPSTAAADDPDLLKRVEPIAARSTRCEAQLAFLGDKSFLLDAKERGYIMYGVEGRSLIAMSDPISEDRAAINDLIWRFAELADEEHATAVFYQVATDNLPAYLDAGFSLVKYGEEAWVSLEAFTLEGSAGRKLRQTRARCEREGLTFEIVPAASIDAIIEEMRRVSHEWLGAKRGEKGFSLGFWSDAYLRRYDTAIIRHAGRIVAFANIWRSAEKAEMSVDLMRHSPDAPAGTMDALFISLMETARGEGYRWFNLGMTPLAGQATHRLASAWARIARFIYRRGDRFYNFSGLRTFKDKFRPEWRPRYIAYRGNASLPQVLFDITRLVSSSRDRAVSLSS
ncbi:MAG: bifunctional lysylphosphatidylglycerol flippase/synthetase MprF [Labrys sp. (in: a-proteobacteria)]